MSRRFISAALFSSGKRIVNDLAAYYRHEGSDFPDLVGRHGEIVAVQDQEIGVLTAADRSEIRFLKYDVGVAAGMGNQRFLARDRLTIDMFSAEHLSRNCKPQRVERIRRRHGG